MTEFISYLDSLTNAKSDLDLWKLHTERMATYGFDRIIYGFTRYRTSRSLGDPQDWVILTNHDPSYMKTWTNEGHYFHAPMLRWALDNDGACSWRRMADMAQSGQLTAGEQRVMAFNLSQKVTAGYTISFRAVSERSKGATALTAKVGMTQDEVDAVWAAHGQEIAVANNVAHLKLLTLPYSGARPLTKRQREVLQWVGDGKTTQDIATLLQLTSATVEKHLRLAREALDVETTAQAVLKASFQNQMFVLDL
jgi:LuxR family transcriptional regulator